MPVDTALNAAVALTQELVRLDTRNPPGNEVPAIELLDGRLRAAGFETTVVPYHDGPNRAHVVGRLRGSGERPALLFSGHVDVVPPGETPWTVAPFGGELRDGRLYGRGSADMKGGVAALQVAAEAVARSGRALKGDLVVAFTADEERNCRGAEALAEEPLFDGIGSAIVAEPTSLRLYIAEKGAFWVQLSVFGRTAHGSMPEAGANAVSAMAEFLVRWEDHYPREHPRHPLLGTPTLNVGTIHGGVKTNVVPDRCVVELDMRTVPGLEHEELLREMGALLTQICERRGTRWSLEVTSDRPSVSAPPDSELGRALATAVRDLVGVDEAPRGVPYCTEACIWVPRFGIPMVICGPGAPPMAHQPDEHVEVRELEVAAQIYARVAQELLT
jgi:succinyl-diaminopimelate desuccinylase